MSLASSSPVPGRQPGGDVSGFLTQQPRRRCHLERTQEERFVPRSLSVALPGRTARAPLRPCCRDAAAGLLSVQLPLSSLVEEIPVFVLQFLLSIVVFLSPENLYNPEIINIYCGLVVAYLCQREKCLN